MLTYEQVKEWSETEMARGNARLAYALQLVAFELSGGDWALCKDTVADYNSELDAAHD